MIATSQERMPYPAARLHQRCSKCDWWQVGHHLELPQCPSCGEPTDKRVALEFGGVIIEFDGVKFILHDRSDSSSRAILDEADYPEAILFLQRHSRWHLTPGRPGCTPHIRSGVGYYREKNPNMKRTRFFSPAN